MDQGLNCALSTIVVSVSSIGRMCPFSMCNMIRISAALTVIGKTRSMCSRQMEATLPLVFASVPRQQRRFSIVALMLAALAVWRYMFRVKRLCWSVRCLQVGIVTLANGVFTLMVPFARASVSVPCVIRASVTFTTIMSTGVSILTFVLLATTLYVSTITRPSS